MNREYHVALTGSDIADGSVSQPFRTISKAAQVAEVGDKVIVHSGVYREWVKPAHSGYSNTDRITYEAAKGEKVIIKGSEQITNWEQVEGTVWKAVVSNTMFGDYNPYKEPLSGDWFIYPTDYSVHAGDVYVNGKSFFEAKSLEDVKHPVKRISYRPPWRPMDEYILEPERTIYQWFAEVDEETTTIYANFHEYNPNEELTEINVRKCCFYPDKVGMNYITVRGFEMAQAACPWTPPTADQPGLLGTHWSKGWIIEDNIIHDAKCSGISIGKEGSTGHNLCTRRHRKPGYQYQMEAVFRALEIGWSKEKIGSHIIRNNVIYDCGQNGIVGHMGCVFSEIYNNHIYNIAKKHEFFGYEIAGIKLHAAVDVKLHNNRIHHCTLGTWFDWQAQGVRISRNLFYDNDHDMMMEVTHGPYLMDHNIFASEYNLDNMAQGGAYINNLCLGSMHLETVLDRSTPYHVPHSTKPAGSTVVYGGDDRFFQNIFVGGTKKCPDYTSCGTSEYNGSPSSLKEYIDKVSSLGNGDLDMFVQVKQPAYINRNAYLNNALAFDMEESNYISATNPNAKLVVEGDQVYLELFVDKELLDYQVKTMDSTDLEMTRITEAPFENPDGTLIVFDTDYFGEKRSDTSCVGPFAQLSEGYNKIKVWG